MVSSVVAQQKLNKMPLIGSTENFWVGQVTINRHIYFILALPILHQLLEFWYQEDDFHFSYYQYFFPNCCCSMWKTDKVYIIFCNVQIWPAWMTFNTGRIKESHNKSQCATLVLHVHINWYTAEAPPPKKKMRVNCHMLKKGG